MQDRTFATRTQRLNFIISNARQPKGFGFTGLDIAKSVASVLGISGIENIKPIWQLASKAVENANPCQCDDRCYCDSCIARGCDTCFSQIHRYVLNMFQKHQ